jgi:hypothetical protein
MAASFSPNASCLFVLPVGYDVFFLSAANVANGFEHGFDASGINEGFKRVAFGLGKIAGHGFILRLRVGLGVANKAREMIPVAFVSVLFATVTTARLKAIKLCAKPSSGLATFLAVSTLVGVVADVVCRVGHCFGFRLATLAGR